MQEGVDAIASTLSDPSVIRLDVALDPDMVRDPRLPGIEPIMLGRPLGDEDWNLVSPVYVATPDVLDVFGLSPSDVAPSDDIVTSADGELEIIDAPPGGPKGTRRGDMEPVATPGTLDTTYTALPQALIAAERARERGWDVVPSGDWIIETARPLTDDERSRARDVAARHDLAIETRDVGTGLEGLRFGAVTVGLLLALGIVAMTVGLLRVESFGELRTLSATGASSATRRSITATTAAALAALGAGLGIAGAYLGLSVGQVANLLPLPALDLIAIAVGLPLAAAAAGWAFAGREPRGLARQPIE
jgi:putative ABC transport system permease protein